MPTKICSQCGVRRDITEFVVSTREYKTCTACRERSNRSSKKRPIQKKQESDPERNQRYAEFYRSIRDLPPDEKKILVADWKRRNAGPKRISDHRKPHVFEDGVEGKRCSTGCGWKPLSGFNYSSRTWDQLRPTCRDCIRILKKRYDERTRDQRKRNYVLRLRQGLGSRIRSLLNGSKEHHSVQYLGCSITHFRAHLESRFLPGMTWENMGSYEDNGEKRMGWHVDHVIPCAAWDVSDPYQVLLCFNYRNTQPLWGIENLRKSARYDKKEKRAYIESMRDVIPTDPIGYDRLREDMDRIVEEEKDLLEPENKQDILDEYLHTRCLVAVQIMFFMYENGVHEKEYKSTPLFLLRNHETRRRGADNPVSRRVCRLSTDGVLLEIHDCIKTAAEAHGTFHSSVSKCCAHPDDLFVPGGFHWCFEPDLDRVRQRCRMVAVLRQLRETIARHRPLPPPAHPQSTETCERISSGIRAFLETDAGRENKKRSHEKRSATMAERRKEIRAATTEKRCRMCEQTLPAASFAARSASADGLQPYCRACFAVRKRAQKSVAV